MKAIAIRSPFASLIALGIIDVWSMPFATDYRGRVLIYADNNPLTKDELDNIPPLWYQICYNNDMLCNVRNLILFDSFPTNRFVGYVDIVDCSDDAAKFNNSVWYQGGIGWRFDNAHYYDWGYKFDESIIKQGIFEAPIDGRTTRHFEPAKPLYPYIKDEILYVHQSIDAWYNETIQDFEQQQTTLWFYADDPQMQLALTGKVGGNEIFPCKTLIHRVDQATQTTEYPITKTYMGTNDDGERCFFIVFENNPTYIKIKHDDEEVEPLQPKVFGVYNVEKDGNFRKWVKSHKEVDCIKLEGKVKEKHYTQFYYIKHLYNKQVDISNLTLDIGEYDNEYEYIKSYYLWHCDDNNCVKLPIILVLCANRHLAQRFSIKKLTIMSADESASILFIANPRKNFGFSFYNHIKHVGNYAYNCTSKLIEVVMHDGIESIGDYAFACCEDLESIYFPHNINKIGEGAFHDTDLLELQLEDGFEVIPERCFAGCYLQTLKLSNSVKVIKDEAFCLYDLMEKLVIPEGVEEIGSNALDGVKEVEFPSTLIRLSDAFYYESGDSGSNKPYITVHPDNPRFYSKNGKIYEHGHVEQYIPYRENNYKHP